MSGPRHRRRLDPDAPLVDLADVLADDELVERLQLASVRLRPAHLADGAHLTSASADRSSPSTSGRHAVSRRRIRAAALPGTRAARPGRRKVVIEEDVLLQDEVFALLAEWRADSLAVPLPSVPAVPVAVRPVTRWRRWAAAANRVTSPRSVRPALAIGGALAGLLMGSAVVSAKEATPDEALFALTTVFWPADAASQNALVDVRTALNAAAEAIRDHHGPEAVAAADRATASLAHVDPDDRSLSLQTTVDDVRAQATTLRSRSSGSVASSSAAATPSSGGAGRAVGPPTSSADGATGTEHRPHHQSSASAGPAPAGPDPVAGAVAARVDTAAATVHDQAAGGLSGNGAAAPARDSAGIPERQGVPVASAGPAGVAADAGDSGAIATSADQPTGGGSEVTGGSAPTTSAAAPSAGSVPSQQVSSDSGTSDTGGASGGTSPTGGAPAGSSAAAGTPADSGSTPSAGIGTSPTGSASGSGSGSGVGSGSGSGSEAPPAPQPTPPPAVSPDPTTPVSSSPSRPSNGSGLSNADGADGTSTVVSPTTAGG